LRASLGKVVDWQSMDKDESFNAMVRRHGSTGELKDLLLQALTEDLGQATYFIGFDDSYYYDG
ncbi:cell filamentation protein Fic, partial [Streptococcus suis]